MAEYPFLPLWTDAYFADTRHLTLEQHGAYLLLIFEAWRRSDCCLPDDDALLARLVGVDAEKWAELKPVVLGFWKHDGRTKKYTQRRLQVERRKVADKREKARDSAAMRWNKTDLTHANAMPSQCERNANYNHSNISKKETTNVVPKKERGSRWTSDKEVPASWIMWAEDESFDQVMIMREANKFPDYWAGISGSKGVKLDWQATWRNWIRTAAQRVTQKPGNVIGFDREAVAREMEKIRNAKKSNI
jgi:uncharacterized protein YdaU (DUF1376 family)